MRRVLVVLFLKQGIEQWGSKAGSGAATQARARCRRRRQRDLARGGSRWLTTGILRISSWTRGATCFIPQRKDGEQGRSERPEREIQRIGAHSGEVSPARGAGHDGDLRRRVDGRGRRIRCEGGRGGPRRGAGILLCSMQSKQRPAEQTPGAGKEQGRQEGARCRGRQERGRDQPGWRLWDGTGRPGGGHPWPVAPWLEVTALLDGSGSWRLGRQGPMGEREM